MIKLIILLISFVSLSVFMWKCSEITTPPSKNEFRDDVPFERFTFSIREHVLVEGPDESYEEDRPLASYSNFSFSPPTVYHDTILTPRSPRYEGGNTITTQYFYSVNGINWICRGTNLGGVWAIEGYVYLSHYLDGYGANCTPPNTHTGSFDSLIASFNLPSNTQIPVYYGIDVIVGGDKSSFIKKY